MWKISTRVDVLFRRISYLRIRIRGVAKSNLLSYFVCEFLSNYLEFCGETLQYLFSVGIDIQLPNIV